MDNFNKTDDLYDPNFSIDSNNTEKLDMYGVWLKRKKGIAEPLDMDDSKAATDSDVDKDLESINFDDDFSFSDADTDIEMQGFDELSDTNSPAEIPLETPAPSYTDSGSSEIALDEESFESLDVDDFFSDDSPAEEAHQKTSDTFVEEEPIDIDFTEITDDTAGSPNNDESPAGLENFTEISLEDFEDATPSDTGSSIDEFETVEDFDNLLQDDSGEQKAEHDERKNETVLDINVAADDEASKIQPLPELSSQIVEDNSDISIFGADEDKTDEKPSDTEEPAFFDDIEAVKQDLLSTQHSAVQSNENEGKTEEPAPEKESQETVNTTAAAPQTSIAEHDKATELLMKIAHEISDLKAELNSLKTGMAAQSKATAETPVKDAVTQAENKATETENSGFFSDDDTDETIALTGDELNNILITADFTEERNAEEGERAAAEEPQAAEPTENYEVPPVLTKDIDPEMEETLPDDHSFEDSIVEPPSADENSNYSPEAEGEKLLADDPVFNVEAAPITSLPEDLSYLDDQSDVTEEGVGLTDEDSTPHHPEEAELEEIEEAEPADEESDFEDINIESFDIPSEQEIEVPTAETEPVTEKARPAAEMPEERTIHELQNDEDFPNPFADASTTEEAEIKEEIIEEPFIAEVSAIEPEVEKPSFEAPEGQIEELDAISEDAIPELAPEAENENAPETPKQETLLQAATKKREATISIPLELKNEIKSVLSYMDQLLEALPEKKIEEFAKSEYFETYKHLFEELGIS